MTQQHGIVQPVATHYEPATCAEMDCPHYLKGWKTTCDETTELGQNQARYIRRMSGRKFTESRLQTGLTEFTFEAGQMCFRQHIGPSGRPPLFIYRNGEQVRTLRPLDWNDHFNETVDRANRTRQAG